jgi:hypothetical protein
MKFVLDNHKVGSTDLGKAVLAAAVPDLAGAINSVANWRKGYLPYFSKVAIAEQQSKDSAFEVATKGLAKFEQSLYTDDGRLLTEAARSAWRENKAAITFVAVSGTGKVKRQDIPVADYVNQRLAEPQVLDYWNQVKLEEIDKNLLIALAGGAEYSPARTWLDWGGTVAVIARAREDLWQELIARARSSAGTLYVPILKSKLDGVLAQNLSDADLARFAGVDLVADFEAIAGYLSMLARSETKGLVLGSYAYAPGIKHIEVQAVQYVLAKVLTESLPKSRVCLTWLATPTDSYALSLEVLDDIFTRSIDRKTSTKIRDFIFGAKRHKPEIFTNSLKQSFVIIDSTSSLQGPSYALAKRIQRWQAYIQLAEGRKAAYLVSPPAKTHSVLDTKILNYTYKGAPKFGLVPFDVPVAVELSTGLLLATLGRVGAFNSISVYQALAVHGGLWRLIYSPKSIWRAATVLGLISRG